jgi:hypothetical protein
MRFRPTDARAVSRLGYSALCIGKHVAIGTGCASLASTKRSGPLPTSRSSSLRIIAYARIFPFLALSRQTHLDISCVLTSKTSKRTIRMSHNTEIRCSLSANLSASRRQAGKAEAMRVTRPGPFRSHYSCTATRIRSGTQALTIALLCLRLSH